MCPDGYGLLWTGFGIGAFAGVVTLTLIKLSHRWRPGIALPLIAGLGFLVSPSLRQLQPVSKSSSQFAD